MDLIIDEAVKVRASDIQIEPEDDRLRIRYRIDGVLHAAMSLPPNSNPPLISRLKIMANMNIADHRPQDGQVTMQIRNHDIELRVATINTTYGESGVIRILDKSQAALKLDELGYLTETLQA